MTRSEIHLVVFIVSALLLGALVQWTRGSAARNAQIPANPTPTPSGWAKPPYVFKSPKEARTAYEKSQAGE